MRAWAVLWVVVSISLSAAAQGNAAQDRNLPDTPEPASSAPSSSSSSSASAPSSSAIEKDPSLAIKPVEAPAYTPLSSRQKFHIFVRQTYSIYTVANTAFDAGWAQLTDDWPAYGMGAEGYGKRYGALLANHEAGSFFENFLFPSALHQDPRYFQMGPGHSVIRRAAYAASRVLVTRADSGSNTFNSSSLLGLLFVDSLTNAYYPRPERGFGDTMSRFGGGVLSNAETNLLREFMPDMMRIFHRHEPERLKKLEQLEKKVPLADKLSPPADATVEPTQSGAAAPASAGTAGEAQTAPINSPPLSPK